MRLEIGDSDFGVAPVAGGSMGTASWGTAVVRACEALLEQGEGEVSVHTGDEIKAQNELSRHAFGAQFVEVRVDADSGEVRVPRVLGVFAVGRVINPKTARSQFIGGMTQGLGMALQEESVMDREFGDYLNHDLASTTSPPTPTSRTSTPSGSTRTTASSTRWAPRASARSASSAPRRRSPTRSSTPPAGACASCRSGSTACSLMILITGATGNIGGATLEALVAQGHRVRAMSRSERSWPEGVEGVTGDLDDPDSLVRAADGVEAVFLLSGYAGTERLLEAVRAAGATRAVLLSSSSAPSGDETNAVAKYHIESERTVRELRARVDDAPAQLVHGQRAAVVMR